MDSAQSLPFFSFSLGRGWIICGFIPFFRRDGTCNVEFRMGKSRKGTLVWRTRVLQVYVLFTLAATFGPTPQANFLCCSTETENCGHIGRRVLRHAVLNLCGSPDCMAHISSLVARLRDASASER